MSQFGVTLLLEHWSEWAAKVLDCGVANIGQRTAEEIRAWADGAEIGGWHQDADLARRLIDEVSSRERANCFLTSVSRLEMAKGLWLVQQTQLKTKIPKELDHGTTR